MCSCILLTTFCSAQTSLPTSKTGPSGSAFNTALNWAGFELAAYADLNTDRQMDVILIDSTGANLYASMAPGMKSAFDRFGRVDPPQLGEPTLLFSPNLSASIRSVAAADFNGDSVLDLLLLTSSSPNSGPYEAHIAYGKTGEDRGKFEFHPDNQPVTFTSQPLVCDLNADMIADLYGEISKTERLIVYGGKDKLTYEKVPGQLASWSPLGYSAFGDVTGDTIPDILILVTHGGETKLEVTTRDTLSNSGLTKPKYFELPPLESASTIGLFTLTDINADGKIELVLPVCKASSCMDTSAVFIFNFDNTRWSEVSVAWQPLGASVGRKWSLAPVDPGNLAVSALVGPAVGDFDLDGRSDLGVGLAYWDEYGTLLGVVPAVLLNEGADPDTGLLKMQAYLLPGAVSQSGQMRQVAFFDRSQQGTVDIFAVFNVNSKPSVSLFMQAMTNDFYYLKVTILNGLCASEHTCTDKRLPYGLPVPGLGSSISTDAEVGGKHKAAALIGMQSCCGALQLPSALYGLGPFANYIDELKVVIPPKDAAIRSFSIPALVPNSEVFVNPFPHDDPSQWTARLFLQPLYNMKVLYIAITLICVCVVLIIIICILQWLEFREDRREKQKEAQRFHYDAM